MEKKGDAATCEAERRHAGWTSESHISAGERPPDPREKSSILPIATAHRLQRGHGNSAPQLRPSALLRYRLLIHSFGSTCTPPMGGASAGALVPSVSKAEEMGASVAPLAVSSSETTDVAGLPPPAEGATVPDGTRAAAAVKADAEAEAERDKDLLCPICMGVIKDAFLTACGHSFCYMCIVTHLNNKSDCPCCGNYLTKNHLYPNFLLNKLLKKQCARQIAKTASPVEHLRLALQQGCEMSVKELDGLLSLLSDKKRKMEQQEAEMNMQILLDFLHCLRKKKLEELNEVQTDLQFIKEDINAVEKHRAELYRARERYSVKLRMLLDDPIATKFWSSTADQHNSILISNARSSLVGTCSRNLQVKSNDVKAQLSHQDYQRKDALSGSVTTNSLIQSGRVMARKRRIQAQVNLQFKELQECYLQKRRLGASQSSRQEEKDANVKVREGYHVGLEDFQSVLTTFTRYSRLRDIAELRHGDLFHSANIVSSIEFDRDDEFFATAGVSKRIKVFEFSTVVNEPSDVNCPVVELATRSKLSCLSWNKYSKNIIASSDYEGIVTVWDVTTRQSMMEYEEHEKRAWSVDFSRMEPTMLVSGSDDCKVKVWCTKQEASVINIDMKANICCVKYNPGSSVHVAVGSADHHIHYFDLRNTSSPLRIFKGHWKAVSYVKFLSTNELASASTDSTLRLWDVKDTSPVRTFKGHTNEKNFVGLTVNNEYIACGSETNEVFVYHKAISKPAAWHKFGSSDLDDAEDDAGSYFISAVCWKSDSPTMLAANSQGTIKVLVLAA
ncbi:E3 ubiquitin-protein ligase [Musa troglodytarum]|uniref:E3 ubiquitin-protein ligase n=1 Tax=Musa troglodytarum TaxID=320322 RepID=A0A9E7JAE1_9LILI|nr:E3 ubiquitin-protein ligase [Musa troglodytarum]